MGDKFKILSNEFEVLVYIYEQTEIEKRNICFSQIVEETELEKQVVSRTIDRLYDHMMIDAEWKKIESGEWRYCFSVSEEMRGFTHGLYNVTQRLSSDEIIKNVEKDIVSKKEKKEVKRKVITKKENEFK